MKFSKTRIPDVVVIEPVVYGDARGFFLENYRRDVFSKNGIPAEFVQDNHSLSQKGILRGLHYQAAPKAQGKLVRCVRGMVFDVAVDIRKGSPTFGQWISEVLSAENKKMIYIPAGFAHGFLSLENDTEVLYKTTDFYSPEHERGIAWNDPALGILWPETGVKPVLSEKDKKFPLLKEAVL
ncbi:MAG TPA: dTDP-4-dehydrorhamnose 3,5-epimerase [Candidatus Omnitrophota bacterium]|nr:dTDP-4-dehydrorhamnose 3,5-epimerase [Candidatus Omnitrophota bacterium]